MSADSARSVVIAPSSVEMVEADNRGDLQQRFDALQQAHEALLARVSKMEELHAEGSPPTSTRRPNQHGMPGFGGVSGRIQIRRDDNEETASPVPLHKRSARNRLRDFVKNSHVILGATSAAEGHQTTNYHMWAVAVVSDGKSSTPFAWLAAILSVCLILMQLLTLGWVNFGAAHPTCSSHLDCRYGEFCDDQHRVRHGSLPRCSDCSQWWFGNDWDWDLAAGRFSLLQVTDEDGGELPPITWSPDDGNLDSNGTSGSMFGSEAEEQVRKASSRPSCTMLQGTWNKSGEELTPDLNIDGFQDLRVWDDMDHMRPYSWLTDPQRPAKNTSAHYLMQCNAVWHCSEMDKWPGECDHIKLTLDKLHWVQAVVLIFVSMLLTVPLAQDMTEAAVEEALLDHALRRANAPRRPVLSAVLRLGLRLRRLVLPGLAISAGVAVLVTSALDAANLLLNVLAVSFIFEVSVAKLTKHTHTTRPHMHAHTCTTRPHMLLKAYAWRFWMRLITPCARQADNMFATLLLRPDERTRASPLMKGMENADPWVAVRLVAVICATAMAACVVHLEALMSAAPNFLVAIGVELSSLSFAANERGTLATSCSMLVHVLQIVVVSVTVFAICIHVIGVTIDLAQNARKLGLSLCACAVRIFGGELVTDLAAGLFGVAVLNLQIDMTIQGFDSDGLGTIFLVAALALGAIAASVRCCVYRRAAK